jgi:hypothetical protein
MICNVRARSLARLIEIGEAIMASLDDIKADLDALQTSATAAVALLDQLFALLQAGTQPDPAKLDALATEIATIKSDLDAAVTKDTPPAPPTPTPTP